jgi:hypothetical protein
LVPLGRNELASRANASWASVTPMRLHELHQRTAELSPHLDEVAATHIRPHIGQLKGLRHCLSTRKGEGSRTHCSVAPCGSRIYASLRMKLERSKEAILNSRVLSLETESHLPVLLYRSTSFSYFPGKLFGRGIHKTYCDDLRDGMP